MLVNKLKVKVTDLAFDKRVDRQIWHLGRGHLNIILAKKKIQKFKGSGRLQGEGKLKLRIDQHISLNY